MKILFVMPKVGAWATHGIHRSPNQLYAHWAAYVRERGYADVAVIDGKAFQTPMDQLVEQVKQANPDVVVMGEQLHGYGGYGVLRHFKEAAQKIKQALPKTKIILGGLWYSAMPVPTLEENPAVDFVVMGEEESFGDLIEAIDKNKNLKDIGGVTSRIDGQIVMGPHKPLMEDLDKLPLPAYDLFPMDKYVGHTYWKPFVDMVTSRGCPSACTFCYEWDQFDPRSPSDFLKWRAKSPERVMEELIRMTILTWILKECRDSAN
ncbi:MAG: cobalamin-dependent protein [Candidatus Omnitrophica bacterium]|nr:cobalamin-dependent protein [Candidatus Omnitrophota bacterium]